MKAASRAGLAEQLESLGVELGLGRAPQRLECFDVSHTHGDGDCVLRGHGPGGPGQSDYAGFNLRDLTPGDDHAGLEQLSSGTSTRVARGEMALPDVLLIDGGPGQLHGGPRRASGKSASRRNHRRKSPRVWIGGQGRNGFWPVRMRRLYWPRALRR